MSHGKASQGKKCNLGEMHCFDEDLAIEFIEYFCGLILQADPGELRVFIPSVSLVDYARASL
jgi:hypothetical protein